jgi:predicted nuclease with TOPRIM domain
MGTGTIVQETIAASDLIKANLRTSDIAAGIHEAFMVIRTMTDTTEDKITEYQATIDALVDKATEKSLLMKGQDERQKELTAELGRLEALLANSEGSLREQYRQRSEEIENIEKKIADLTDKCEEAKKRLSLKNIKLWISFYNIFEAVSIRDLVQSIKRKQDYIKTELEPALNELQSTIKQTEDQGTEIKKKKDALSTSITNLKSSIEIYKKEQSFFNYNQAICIGVRDYFYILRDSLNKALLDESKVKDIIEFMDLASAIDDLQALYKIHEEQQQAIEIARRQLAADDREFLNSLFQLPPVPVTNAYFACNKKGQNSSASLDEGMQVNSAVVIDGNTDLSGVIQFNNGGCVYWITLTYSNKDCSYIITLDGQGPKGLLSGSGYLKFTFRNGETQKHIIFFSKRSNYVIPYAGNGVPEITKIQWNNTLVGVS